MGADATANTAARAGRAMGGEGDSGLLLVKLSPPFAEPHLTRPHLVRRLLDNAATPLTLICAPVGWGKTSLLGTWLRHPRETRAVAWLSLDTDDDEPTRFWRYVVAAVRGALPDTGDVAAGGLLVAGADPIATAVPALLNDLATSPDRAILVLDDYHVIRDPRIHEAVEYLVTYLPPSLRIVLSARHDPPLPLARLRGRGQLTELRAADLRLSPGEVADLLTDRLGVDVGEDLAAEVAARTEGWPVAVHLAGIAVRSSDEPLNELRRLPDDHRDLTDLLLAEVLDRLDAGDEDRLVRTSILVRLSAPLCEAVLDVPLEPGWLDRLVRSGLPLSPLSHRREWYRLNPLVAAVLRQRLRDRLPAGEIDQLHERAAEWFLGHDDLESAVGHFLAGGQHTRVAALLTESLRAFAQRGAVGSYARFGDRLPAELLDADPRLAVTLAWANGISGRHQRARELSAAAGRGDNGDDPPPGWRSAASAAAALRVCFVYVTEVAELHRLAAIAVEREVDQDLPGYYIARSALGLANLASGSSAEAIAALTEALSPQLDLLPAGTLINVGLLGGAKLDVGDLDGARALLDHWLPALDDMEAAVGDACAAATLTMRHVVGQLARLRGDLADAEDQLERAVAAGRVFGVAAPLCDALVSLAEIRQLDRRPAEARTALREATELAASEGVPPDTAAKLEAAEELLGRSAQRIARRDGALVEELTDRELSILRAMQGDLSLRDLAGQLYLSLNTVKGYAKVLYRKLDVHTRTDAIARGRELGVL